MTTRLQLYNNALLRLGERRLASLSENRESRRVMDQIWDSDVIDAVLEQGMWNHAIKTVEISYSPSVDPDFGFKKAFDKPDDFVRIVALCSDEYFQNPLNAYQDEGNFWFCDLETIYVRYVSNDEDYGGDMAAWPESFCEYVELFMAEKACKRLTQSTTDHERIKQELKKALADARSKDAQKEPTAFLPRGSWVRSRQSRQSWRR